LTAARFRSTINSGTFKKHGSEKILPTGGVPSVESFFALFLCPQGVEHGTVN
jgi:hypothetical protein